MSTEAPGGKPTGSRGVSASLVPASVDAYTICGVRPRAVVRIESVEQLAGELAAADERSWSVAPHGGGTMLDLGNPPQALDLLLDLRGLNRVLDYQPDDLTLTVQAGVTVSEVGRLLAERGQMLALDVPLPERATIGGALATNASGPRRTRFGTARDLCIGVQVALAHGTLARSGGKVVKNVAGYDLNKLHIGALGTAGIITEATFKLWPAPERQAGLIAEFESLAAAHAAAIQLLNGHLFPAAVEIAGPGAARRLLQEQGRSLPDAGWLLSVLMLGSQGAVARQVRDVEGLCREAGAPAVRVLHDAARDNLFAGIRDFGRADESSAAMIVKAAVLPSQLTTAASIVDRLGTAIGAPPELLCRPSAGLVFGFWPGVHPDGIADGVTRARADLAAIAGTLTIERTPVDAVAGTDVWGLDGPDIALMRRLKHTYDPNGILNRGRFVAGL